VKLGLINTVGNSNKALVVQQKYKSKNAMKQHPHHTNKEKRCPKPSLPTSAPNGYKGEKTKIKKISDMHCNVCGKHGHLESKYFKKMEALEATLKKHNTSIYSSSSSSHGHELSTFGFSFSATSTCSSYE
jgi:hypothetical protein